MTVEELIKMDEEVKKIDDNMRKTEEEGVKSVLKYFDRIHDKLFSFNNIMIAGFFALSQFNYSVPLYLILIPIINLVILIFIEYRMMKKSRLDASIMSKDINQISQIGLVIRNTNLYSLLTIITTTVVGIIFLCFLLGS
jgi:hypothetical protein